MPWLFIGVVVALAVLLAANEARGVALSWRPAQGARSVRGRVAYILAAVALLAAIVLALVGVAVLDVAADAEADDRVVANAAPDPEAARHERPVGVRIGEAILGVADDRSYRDAVELAKASTLESLPPAIVLERRAEAIAILGLDRPGRRRPRAARPAPRTSSESSTSRTRKTTTENPRRLLEQSLGAFQEAAMLDPANETVKANLELLATLPAATRFQREEASGAEASASPTPVRRILSLTFLAPLGALVALAVLLPVAGILGQGAPRCPGPRRAGSRVAAAQGGCAGGRRVGRRFRVVRRRRGAARRAGTEHDRAPDRCAGVRRHRHHTFHARRERAQCAASASSGPRTRRSPYAALLPDVPVGVASITNRPLPHLFPTADADQFELVVR